MKYVFDLGTYDKNVEAFKLAVMVLNKKYGYPNDMGTQTASDMYTHPDGVKIAMDVPVKEDSAELEGGEFFEALDPSWDEAKIDQKIAKDLAEEEKEEGDGK